MQQTKTITFNNLKTESLKLIVLFGLAILAPLIQNQLITGTIVNAILFISVFVLGFRKALLIAFFPSLISLGLGLLPAVMAPMTPFIILGNIILVGLFAMLKNKNYWFAAVSGAIIKFVWLLITSQIIISLFIKGAVSTKIAAMMSWPQLVTAIFGSVVAYFLKDFFLKSKN